MRVCSRCGAESKDSAAFCRGCGSPLAPDDTTSVASGPVEETCENCGEPGTAGAPFCRHCGHARAAVPAVAPTAVSPVVESGPTPGQPPIDLEGEPEQSIRNKRSLLIGGAILVAMLLLGAGAAALFLQDSDDETDFAEAGSATTSTSSSTSTTTTSTSTTTTAVAAEAARPAGEWVVQFASVPFADGQGEMERQLSDLRSVDPAVSVISSDDWASFVPGYWVIVDTGPWSSGRDAAEYCGSLGRATPSECLGRFVSDNPADRDVQCYRSGGAFLPTCDVEPTRSIPARYDGELLHDVGFSLPVPATVVDGVYRDEEADVGYHVEETFTIVVDGATEDNVIRQLEQAPMFWTLTERTPGDPEGREGPSYLFTRPCGHECGMSVTVQFYVEQGSEQLRVDNEYGVSGPSLHVTFTLSGV